MLAGGRRESLPELPCSERKVPRHAQIAQGEQDSGERTIERGHKEADCDTISLLQVTGYRKLDFTS